MIEDATPYIEDLPPSHYDSIGSRLVGQAVLGDLQMFSKAHVLLQCDDLMVMEYSSLMKNETWELVPVPKGRKLVLCKQVY